jgi:hypothetical protein
MTWTEIKSHAFAAPLRRFVSVQSSIDVAAEFTVMATSADITKRPKRLDTCPLLVGHRCSVRCLHKKTSNLIDHQ